jgi:transposase
MKTRVTKLQAAILRVQTGLCTATAAARSLGMSRKTYYQWETRAMAAMRAALTPRPPGRPRSRPDPQMQALREQLERLKRENRLLEQRLRIHRLLGKAETRSERNHAVAIVLRTLQKLHAAGGGSYRRLAAGLGLARSSVLRWQAHLRAGLPAIRRPGRVKPPLPNPRALQRDLARLQHGAHRTHGATAFYRRWSPYVSRRDLGDRLRAHRLALQRAAREALERIQWAVPGAVWAMDPAELGAHRWNTVTDVSSRFRLPLWLARDLPTEAIVSHLRTLFERYVPPLILKRDNGSNLNARPRPCLAGATAEDVFMQSQAAFARAYPLDLRKAIKRWIDDATRAILETMTVDHRHTRDAARRHATETWMLEEGLVIPVRHPNVLPLSA